MQLAKWRRGYWKTFLLFILIYEAYLLAFFPWFFSNQMWAEMAANYLPVANSAEPFRQLFAPDSGYIPAPQRLIALFFTWIKAPFWLIPTLYNQVSIILTSILVSPITLKYFRRVIESDVIRYALALTLLLVPRDFEIRTFINFSYFGLVPVLFFGLAILVDRKLKAPAPIFLTLVFFVSKPIFILMSIWIILMTLRRGTSKSVRIFASLSGILSLLQIFSLFSNYEGGKNLNIGERDPARFVETSMSYFFGVLGRIATGNSYWFPSAFAIFIGIVLFAAVIAFAKFTLLRRAQVREMLFSLLIVSAGVIVFNQVTLSSFWATGGSQLDWPPIWRHVFLIYACIATLLALTVDTLRIGHRGKTLFMVVPMTLWLSAALVNPAGRPMQTPVVGNSHWELTKSRNFDPLATCVPVDPLGWTLGNGCRMLNSELTWDDKFEFSEFSRDHTFTIEPRSDERGSSKLWGVGFYLDFTETRSCISKTAIVRIFESGIEREKSIVSALGFGTMEYVTLPVPLALQNGIVVKLETNCESSIAYSLENKNQQPAIFLFGRD